MTVFVKWRKEWKILAGEMRRYLRPALLIIIAAFGVLWYSLYGDVKVGQRHDHGWCYKLTVQYKELIVLWKNIWENTAFIASVIMKWCAKQV